MTPSQVMLSVHVPQYELLLDVLNNPESWVSETKREAESCLWEKNINFEAKEKERTSIRANSRTLNRNATAIWYVLRTTNKQAKPLLYWPPASEQENSSSWWQKHGENCKRKSQCNSFELGLDAQTAVALLALMGVLTSMFQCGGHEPRTTKGLFTAKYWGRLLGFGHMHG